MLNTKKTQNIQNTKKNTKTQVSGGFFYDTTLIIN